MIATSKLQSQIPSMETPCVNICAIDPANRLCTGCGRSIDEISRWASMSSAERRRVMSDLPARKPKT